MLHAGCSSVQLIRHECSLLAGSTGQASRCRKRTRTVVLSLIKKNSDVRHPADRSPITPSSMCCYRYLHERGKRERVARVLEAEDAQQKAIHEEQYCAPDKDCNLLSLGISHARHFDSQSDGAKGEQTVCAMY